MLNKPDIFSKRMHAMKIDFFAANADSALTSAFVKWEEYLGIDRVLQDPEAIWRYRQCTGTSRQAVPAVLLPQTTQEIVDIVRTAARYNVPIYPISTGKNWGYGGANPASPGSVIIDLSRLNRIVDFDSELGLITIEPGVTQQQLADYLDQNGFHFMVPTTGGGPTCSIVGNALERGYGITPISDHFAAVMSLEAVLPNGSIYRSALSELGATQIDRAFKWGVGPYLDGLFAQGNFGIVTQMTIKLAKTPACFKAFYFGIFEDHALEALVEAVQKTMSRLGGIVGSINLMNQHRILAMTVPYPSSQVGKDGLLPTDVIAKLGRENKTMAWTGVGALYGEKLVVEAAQKIVKNLLGRATDKLLFLTPKKVKCASQIAKFIPKKFCPNLQHRLRILDDSLQLMLGRPREVALNLAYWKKGGTSEKYEFLDPARDGCGLIWYPPLVPIKKAAVREYVTHVKTTCFAHNIEPLITLTALSDHCFDSTVPILFDRENAIDTAAADRCYRALFEGGLSLGFVPYRLGPQSMSRMTGSGGTYWDLVAKLKEAVDPVGILSPGRYAPA
ncbi:MAG: FAD-binding oxidoreductase [Pseudomonadota bacterium]